LETAGQATALICALAEKAHILSQAQYRMKAQTNSPAQTRRISIIKPLTFVDLETTGSIIGLDRIVEVGALKIMPDGEELEFETRVNPEMGITTEATKMHAITNPDVQRAPTFGGVAPRLADFLSDSDLAGYNLLNFDLPILQSEFQRVGHNLPMEGRRVIDVLDIFVRKEPRDLKAAYRFYCGREYEGAHSASADARACWHVLQGQVRRYKDIPKTAEGLGAYVAEHRKKRTLDSGGWFISRYGKPALARGKHQGMLIREVEERDPDYLDWMLSVGLPEDTIEVIRTVLPDFGR
jgi:DNA polymerase-3 subunit epsilon